MTDFDLASAERFSLLTALGLRDFHFVLEMGCGALGTARLLIPYLLAGRYFGIESEQRLVEEGVRLELGHDLLDLKKPRFLISPEWRASEFGIKFDYAMATFGAPETRACLGESARCLRKSSVLVTSSDNPERVRDTAAEVGMNCKAIDWPHHAGETWVLLYLSGGDEPPDPSYRFQVCNVSDLSEVQVVQDAACGYVESIVDDGDRVTISGWAIHPETGAAATHVLVADSRGCVIGKSRVGIPRSDVASVHGRRALRSGFRLLIAKAAASVVFAGITAGEKKAFALGKYG